MFFKKNNKVYKKNYMKFEIYYSGVDELIFINEFLNKIFQNNHVFFHTFGKNDKINEYLEIISNEKEKYGEDFFVSKVILNEDFFGIKQGNIYVFDDEIEFIDYLNMSPKPIRSDKFLTKEKLLCEVDFTDIGNIKIFVNTKYKTEVDYLLNKVKSYKIYNIY